MNTEEMVIKASKQNKCIGMMKYLYYMSPIGWLFHNKKHTLCRDLTYNVWKIS